ncbi:hypothetical protein BX666DRAFT_1994005 [Dichotomocladium elegans]|nr:hypothetical protein BX666DRAFT_1994005 [Dichotomocladium elegans]
MIHPFFGSLVAAYFLLFYRVQAGHVIQVVDATNFCTFLPPSDSTDRLISDTEWNGAVFCMGNTPKATSSGTLSTGFIQSAHFVATDDYIQITGQINPSKENLDLTDWGGQYDIKAPDGASCAGYSYFVNLIEPASYTYCIRCCNTAANCNRGISEKGCAHIIPGDYSGPMDTSITGSTATPSISTTTIAAAAPATSNSKTIAKQSPSSSSSPITNSTKAGATITASSAATTSHAIVASSQNAPISSGSAVASAGSPPSDTAVFSSILPQPDSVSAQSVNTKSSTAVGAVHPSGVYMISAFVAVLVIATI